MSAEKRKQRGVLGLVVALIVVLVGGLLFMGAVSGWFEDPKVTIDSEYHTKTPDFLKLSKQEYDDLIANKKSFIVFIDQDGCTTADRLRGYMKDYMNEMGLLAYKMMFSEMKETSLHDSVKYYPSVVIVDRGVVKTYLRADSDDDSAKYNDYESFVEWMNRYIGGVENFGND